MANPNLTCRNNLPHYVETNQGMNNQVTSEVFTPENSNSNISDDESKDNDNENDIETEGEKTDDKKISDWNVEVIENEEINEAECNESNQKFEEFKESNEKIEESNESITKSPEPPVEIEIPAYVPDSPDSSNDDETRNSSKKKRKGSNKSNCKKKKFIKEVDIFVFLFIYLFII